MIVSSINQGSLTAYFLRRDLFSTLVKFMTDDATAPFAFESTLLLGLLANFRKYEARNPYGVRIEDFVEDGVMSVSRVCLREWVRRVPLTDVEPHLQRIIDVVLTVSHRARDSYIAITDDSPPSFVASLTSLVFSFRITELLGGFSMSLPPAPSPTSAKQPTIASVPNTPSLKGKEKEDVNGSAAPTPIASPVLPSSPLHGDAPSAAEVASSIVAGAGDTASPSKGGSKVTPAPAASTTENAFKKMPPEIVVILLPFYDLLNLNKAFCALVFNETNEGGEFSLAMAALLRPLLTLPPSSLQRPHLYRQPSFPSLPTSCATPPPPRARARTLGFAFSSSSCSSRRARASSSSRRRLGCVDRCVARCWHVRERPEADPPLCLIATTHARARFQSSTACRCYARHGHHLSAA